MDGKIKTLRSAVNFLEEIINGYGTLAVAVSGGADSTLLAKFAAGLLPTDRLLLVHAELPFSPVRETSFIKQWASKNSLPLQILSVNPLLDAEVAGNGDRRCYYCKRIIMKNILEEAEKRGISTVADGTVADDFGDYRPGLEAAAELGIRHPLAEAGFDKRLVRLAARSLRLPNWNMPASACLASRIPCGMPIDMKIIAMVEKAEEYLFSLGFAGCRVRVPAAGTACIEVPRIYLRRLFRKRDEISAELQEIGFTKITMDLNGYRKGSMNRI